MVLFFVFDTFLSQLLFMIFIFHVNLAHSQKLDQHDKVFRLHLSSEPLSLDPTKQKGSGSSFLLNSIYLPLFKSDLNQAYKPSVLKDCRWVNQLELSCQLVAGLHWSNGSALGANDVKKSFDYFKSSQSNNKQSELVQNIKTVNVKKNEHVIFMLKTPEARFMEKLTSPLLSPIFDSKFPKLSEISKLVTSGPYKIESWESKRKITLIPNSFFKGHPQRPKVEFYIITEESTALLLYESNQLDFLRRLPTAFIDRYQSTPDFKQVPIVRFDYIGFGPALNNEPELRKQLSHALNYNQWSQFLRARGRPGCYGIALDLLNFDPCLNYEPENFPTWKKEISSRQKLVDLTLHYSNLGGDDHKKSMEWVQNEWKKNLGLKVVIKGVENAIFQKELQDNPPALFRVGISLEHLSCSNALDSFIKSIHHPLIFNQKALLDKIDQLKNTKQKNTEATLCNTILTDLIDNHWIIPLGRIHLSLLAKPEWQGWSLSPLNVLDLSDLHYSK